MREMTIEGKRDPLLICRHVFQSAPFDKLRVTGWDLANGCNRANG
jgi:hypothetical protein